MKLMKRFGKNIKSIIIPAAVFCLAVPCADALAGEYAPSVVTFHYNGEETTDEHVCYFDSDLPEVPYVNVLDYLTRLYTANIDVEKVSDCVYSYTKMGKKMTVDTENNTVSIEDYATFYTEDSEYAGPGFPYVNIIYSTIGDASNVTTLDLNKYGIILLDDGNNAYMPLPTLSDLFSISSVFARYNGKDIYFANYYEPFYGDMSPKYEELTRSRAYIDFCYNEFCLLIDNFYGRPSAGELAKSIEEKGFDKTLDEFSDDTRKVKELLLSDKAVDFYYGISYLDPLFWDGGHTVLSYGEGELREYYPNSSFKQTLDTYAKEHPESPLVQATYFANGMVTAIDDRQKVYKEVQKLCYNDQMSLVMEWEHAWLYQKDDTQIFVFDSFEESVIEPFARSLENAKENGIRNFIIDVSANSGGATMVVSYIMSMISDNYEEVELNTFTGNTSLITAKADKNLDYKIDEKDDEIKYDLNFAFLTSNASFSSANLLPCLAAECGIPIIGGKSNGGSCVLVMGYHANGMVFGLSGPLKVINKSGTDLDSGAPLYYEVPGVDEDISLLYDVDNIIKHVDEFYGKSYPTGDTASVVGLELMMMVAAGGAGIVFFRRKRG